MGDVTKILYVTQDHKTSQFSEIEIYTSSENWINKLSIYVCFVMIWRYTTIWKSGIWGCKKSKYWIAFQIVKMKSLAMYITNQK